jgi:hypothetical protein
VNQRMKKMALDAKNALAGIPETDARLAEKPAF